MKMINNISSFLVAINLATMSLFTLSSVSLSVQASKLDNAAQSVSQVSRAHSTSAGSHSDNTAREGGSSTGAAESNEVKSADQWFVESLKLLKASNQLLLKGPEYYQQGQELSRRSEQALARATELWQQSHDD